MFLASCWFLILHYSHVGSELGVPWHGLQGRMQGTANDSSNILIEDISQSLIEKGKVKDKPNACYIQKAYNAMWPPTLGLTAKLESNTT